MGTAIEALEADREALLDICAKLGDSEWKADSGCPGWSVQDVVAHMGALFWMLVDPSTVPDVGGRPTEQANEVHVGARRTWSAEQVVEDYRSVSSQAIWQLAELQTQDFEVPLGDLGTYHASLLPNAFAFDHYTHIRADLFPPLRPTQRHPTRLRRAAPGAGHRLDSRRPTAAEPAGASGTRPGGGRRSSRRGESRSGDRGRLGANRGHGDQ